jgi:methionyl-tRNA formyltransferase
LREGFSLWNREYLFAPLASPTDTMRFAIAAIDRYLGVFEVFVQAGWKPLKLFTIPLKCDLDSQQAVIAYAEQHGAAIQLSRITTRDLAELREQECDALIIASYGWKIEDWRPFLKYAVNFHSSPLPEGRGPYPVMRAILENRPFWAVTCHQITPAIDQGDILAAERFPLQPDECHESLDLKIQMAAKRLAGKVVAQFAELWDQARPQGEGSYWKKHKLHEHVIDFQKPVESIMRHVRAFGMTGSLAKINNRWLIANRAVGWTETHNHVPGHVAHVYNRSIVVAVSDGYIGFFETSLAPINVVTETQAELNALAATTRQGW